MEADAVDGVGGTLLSQGAEARIFRTIFLQKDVVVKERFNKHYRHPVLDKKLTTKRLQTEVRCMVKAVKAGIETPTIYFVDSDTNRIFMEFVDGLRVRDYVESNRSEEEKKALVVKVGEAVARLHDNDIIHGDLTTSNFLVRTKSEEIVAIDFGLSFISHLPEDKAVDLYVLERAFLSTHANSEKLFEELLSSYQASSKRQAVVIQKLNQVRLRGRKKAMIG